MTAHTSGPWHVHVSERKRDPADCYDVPILAESACSAIAQACDLYPKDGGALTRDANARLIAAAPELLAACELFTAAAHDARDALNGAGIACPSSIALAAEKARAAIADATGQPWRPRT